MNMDDFDDSDIKSVPRKSSIKTAPSDTTATAKATADPTTSEEEDEDDPFFDPTLPAAEPIQEYRAHHEKIRFSTDPNNHEAFQRMYRAIADDPALLAQLQPKDFMFALNSTRDMLHVIPRMQRILRDVEKTSYRHIPELYHILLKAYIKLSDFQNCSNLLQRMKKSGFLFGTSTYHILLSLCKHERSLAKARRVLNEMRENKVPVTSKTYLMMLSICAICNKPKVAQEYFDEMPLFSLEADVSHYNALLNAYVRARDIQGALKIYQEIEDEGITPDSYTDAAIVRILTEHKREPEAHAILNRYKTDGNKPHFRVLMGRYRTLIGSNMGAIELLQICQENGTELTVKDFNTLISTALRKNTLKDVPALYAAMSKQGHRPDVISFSVLLDANLKMGKYDEAKEIFRAMEQANVQPDVIAYSSMISGAIKHSKFAESLEFLKSMLADGLLPNLLTVNSLLSASIGKIDVATFELIRQTMDTLHIRPDQRSFNALLSACALQGDMEEMSRTLKDMKRAHVSPDALTYSILISGYLQNGDLRYSMEWYYKMLENRMIPATSVVNKLMAALHGAGQDSQVLVLWHELNRLGIRKNEETFEIAFEACKHSKNGRVHQEIEDEFKLFLAKQALSEEKRHGHGRRREK
ncbi:hypothetical protein BGZ94_000731 [Podila epigama]|nr:hypothetical protein BGZ94_000731 [Podila epigama]